MHRLKNKNLISGFRAAGIYPLDRNQVLKHIPTSYSESAEVNAPLFNESVLSVLKENCGIGVEKVKNISKRGQKIIPGQPILQLHVGKNSPSGDQPSSSKNIKKENLHPKKSNKKRKPPQKIITDDDWICADCGEVWDDDGDCRWITCDICVSNYHLECLGIQYPPEHYWDIDLDSREFECSDCVIYFQSD